MSSGVVTAGPADLDALSQVVSDAFFDLPPSRWLIDDPVARKEIFPGYFRLIIEQAMAAGVVQTTPDRTAAALWLPGGGEEGGDEGGDEGAATGAGENGAGEDDAADGYPAALAALAGPWVGRFQAFDATLESSHPGARHHYLALIGVAPQVQGQGQGTALLRAYHEALDRDSREPAYLEAGSPRTRQIYLRHGYADLGPPIQLPDGGPQMYPMWREPA
jgi:GNAT superfamily N-acetyltransferase